MKVLPLSFALIAGTAFVTSVFADHSMRCLDQISMQLQEEGWVTSSTAQVTVSIQAATSKNSSAAILKNITQKLKSIIKDSAPWRLVDLSTEKNTAGLLAVSAAMTARLNSDQLAQLQSHIETLNKAGEQYKITNVDYQPQLSEISAENSRLRALLYKDVLEQQKMINAAFSGVSYQLQTLTFSTDSTLLQPAPVMFAAAGRSVSNQVTSSVTPFSQQIILSANVTFSTPNLACEKFVK